MLPEDFFPPPPLLRRTLNCTYLYNGELSSVDPRRLNNDEELQEKVDRMHAIIEHAVNVPDEPNIHPASAAMQDELPILEALLASRHTGP